MKSLKYTEYTAKNKKLLRLQFKSKNLVNHYFLGMFEVCLIPPPPPRGNRFFNPPKLMIVKNRGYVLGFWHKIYKTLT